MGRGWRRKAGRSGFGTACAAALALTAACGGSPTGGDAPDLVVEPSTALLVGTDASQPFRALDGTTPIEVDWSVDDPEIASVDANGRVRALSAGTTSVVARRDGATAAARVEVYVPPSIDAYAPGERYFGRRDYVEYRPGTLPVIVSAPHGGDLEPSEIPDREGGTQVTDTNTRQTATAIRNAFLERFGAAPHLVVLHLDRDGLDANREIGEAAEGNPFAEQAWREYHGFIDAASETVETAWGSGLYLDIHGHGHDIPRVELGYLVSSAVLGQSDAAINGANRGSLSSLAALQARRAAGGDDDFAALLRGPKSMGGLLQERGFRSVPSPADPDPGGAPYFTGGYSTARHGSVDGGTVDGIQLELHYPGVRDTGTSRTAFAEALADAVAVFLAEHYGHTLQAAVAAPRAGVAVGR